MDTQTEHPCLASFTASSFQHVPADARDALKDAALPIDPPLLGLLLLPLGLGCEEARVLLLVPRGADREVWCGTNGGVSGVRMSRVLVTA
jgi:hypothetical protein